MKTVDVIITDFGNVLMDGKAQDVASNHLWLKRVTKDGRTCRKGCKGCMFVDAVNYTAQAWWQLGRHLTKISGTKKIVMEVE